MIEVALQTVTPGSQAIALADAKQHLRIEFDTEADNAEINNMVISATRQVEVFTSRVCMATVYDFHLTGFPTGGIVLPVSPVTAVTSVKYYSDAVTQATLSSSEYYYNLHEEPLKIRPVGSWPDAYDYKADAVTVRFTAGYTSAANVPRSLRQAILLVLGDIYEHRSDAVREKFTLWKMVCYGDKVIHDLTANL